MRNFLSGLAMLAWMGGIGCDSSSSSSDDGGVDAKIRQDVAVFDAPSANAPTLPFDIKAAPNPDPPKIGKNTIKLTVTGANGVPVAGATVKASYLMTNMPGMGGDATVSEQGNGVYSTDISFTMEGPWKINVTVALGDQTATQSFTYELSF